VHARVVDLQLLLQFPTGIFGRVIYRWKDLENSFPTIYHTPKNSSRKLQKKLTTRVVGLHKTMDKRTALDFECGLFLPCFVIVLVLDIFQKFWPLKLQRQIVRETNLYASEARSEVIHRDGIVSVLERQLVHGHKEVAKSEVVLVNRRSSISLSTDLTDLQEGSL